MKKFGIYSLILILSMLIFLTLSSAVNALTYYFDSGVGFAPFGCTEKGFG